MVPGLKKGPVIKGYGADFLKVGLIINWNEDLMSTLFCTDGDCVFGIYSHNSSKEIQLSDVLIIQVHASMISHPRSNHRDYSVC